MQRAAPWALGGIGLEGNPATNRLVAESDLIISVGTRLTDFATGSQTMFANPEVRFASINIAELDAIKQGAAAVVADARLGIDALAESLGGYRVSGSWADEIAPARAVVTKW